MSWQARPARVIGYLRAAVGMGLIMAPRAAARLQADQSPTGTTVLLIRTIGIRDLVLGAGTVAAAQAAGDEGVRRWITFGLLSDALDVVAGAISGSLLGRKVALTAAGVPVPFVLADLWALGHLRSQGDAPPQLV
jgi:hypothetical protein